MRSCVDHITDTLVSLHWLRVPERIDYKIAVLTYWQCFPVWWFQSKGVRRDGTLDLSLGKQVIQADEYSASSSLYTLVACWYHSQQSTRQRLFSVADPRVRTPEHLPEDIRYENSTITDDFLSMSEILAENCLFFLSLSYSFALEFRG